MLYPASYHQRHHGPFRQAIRDNLAVEGINRRVEIKLFAVNVELRHVTYAFLIGAAGSEVALQAVGGDFLHLAFA